MFLIVQQKINELESICTGIEVLKELTPRTQARVLSMGEKELSTAIIRQYLISNKLEIEHLNSKALIVTNDNYLKGEVDTQRDHRQHSKSSWQKELHRWRIYCFCREWRRYDTG